MRAAFGHPRGNVRYFGGLDGTFSARAGAGTLAALAAVVALVPAAAAAGVRGGGPALVTPLDGEASFGQVVVRAPLAARDAVLVVGGRQAGWAPVENGEARFERVGRTGALPVVVRFVGSGGTRLGEVRAARVWFLPAAAGLAVRRATRPDPALTARLAALGRAYPGWAGLWVANLATGRYASWNADASFLAASTVKLGVMVETLRRLGARPELTAEWPDVAAMVSLSSNDAANRLFLRLGGGSESVAAARVNGRFTAIGLRDTTFPGTYRGESAWHGSAAPAAGAARALDIPNAPPLRTWRRTTARDMGILVRALHAAAAGDPQALARTGLSVHQARLALALMLDAKPEGGPLGGAVTPGVPVAQKTGWTDKARHAAAIVYARGGPIVVVVLTYRLALDAGASARLARSVASLMGVGPGVGAGAGAGSG